MNIKLGRHLPSFSVAILFLASFFLFSIQACAQFNSVKLGINGLTCSLCVRSVELSVKELDFVKAVDMNLKETRAEIFFEEDSSVSIQQLAKKVRDAGFSVRFIKGSLNLENAKAQSTHQYHFGKDVYLFVGKNTPKAGAAPTVTFIGEAYQARKIFKKWKAELPTEQAVPEGSTLYFVAL